MIKRFNESSETKQYYAVKYKDGRFLKLHYVTKFQPRSEVSLTETDFPCWKTEEEAKGYIENGEDMYYSYSDMGLDINDFIISKFIIN